MRARRLMAVAVIGLFALQAQPAAASGPTIERGRFEEYFFDDFFYELCGIETYTTWTQTWSVKTFPDGSEIVHVVRTFTPDDPRIPVERGAGTSFHSPDGTVRVVGMPLQLFEPGGGIRLLDAGSVTFGDDVIVHGHHPVRVWETDLTPYYCPPG
jgi:hypothetical protein